MTEELVHGVYCMRLAANGSGKRLVITCDYKPGMLDISLLSRIVS